MVARRQDSRRYRLPDDRRNQLRWGKCHTRYLDDCRAELPGVELLVQLSRPSLADYPARHIGSSRIHLLGCFLELPLHSVALAADPLAFPVSGVV